MSVFVSVFFLNKWRYETGKPLDAPDREEEEVDTSVVEIPFQKVNLTFVDMHYTVTTSTSNEKLELLKGIDGFVEAGKMTALMGSSGRFAAYFLLYTPRRQLFVSRCHLFYQVLEKPH